MRIPSIASLLTLTALALAACGGNSTTQSTTTSGTGGNSTTSGTGAAPQTAGRHGADFVAAGNRSSAGSRAAVSTLGQSPGANGVSRSAKYQFVGGLVASTQP